MNTQNIPKQNNQNNIDYFKDLKDVNKEIDKIYKKLSKDEAFADILENIKTDFIKNNIAIIQENLSKTNLTNYKDFNGKIIKMLEILIKLLIGYTSYKDNLTENDSAVSAIKLVITVNKIKEIKDTDGSMSYQRITRDELNNTIEENEKFKKIRQASRPKDASIIKNICIFHYYLDIFEKNDSYGTDLDNKIKVLNDSIANLMKNGVEKRANQAELDNYNKFNREKEEVKKHNEDNKKIYKELFDYIQLATFDIFENLSDTAEETEKNEKTQGKDKTDNKTYVEKFKNEIYYEIININNFQVNDDYAKLKDNSNEKIDLDLRKKTLADMKDLLDKQLKKLYTVIENLISAKKEEYSTEIIDIRKTFKDYTKEKEYKDSILTLIVNEESEVNKLLTRNADDKKRLETLSKQQRGGEKKSNKYYEEKYTDIKTLNNKICNLIKKIKEVEGIEDGTDPFEKNNTTMFGDASEGVTSIYKNIWKDYIKDTKKTKSKGTTVENLKIDNRLYDRFKENDLDPNDILKVSFQDKVIFLCVILIIRTFAIVFIEFLIEYNIVSTLYRGIIVYLVLYITLIICGVLLINYDSYKLRILVNYLNLHINSSNIFFHILLFILFIGLILIIINNNDSNNIDFDNVLNYTYIYKYIYEIAEKSKPMSYLKLSQKEKVKLQYRLDIITMIVFIFSSLLILIM